jgi:hypothetical protein
MLSIRWGVQVQFAPNQSLIWAPNKQFKSVSTISGQRAAVTEAIRDQMESSTEIPKARLMFTVADGWSRYPVGIAADMNMSRDQLVEVWYQKDALVPGWDAKKYPRVALACVMRNETGHPVWCGPARAYPPRVSCRANPHRQRGIPTARWFKYPHEGRRMKTVRWRYRRGICDLYLVWPQRGT